MPLAMTVPTNLSSDRSEIRGRHGLPDQAVVFIFSFDLNSSIHRKNQG